MSTKVNRDALNGGFCTDYAYTNKEDPHRKRTQYILKNYPQIKALMGPYPLSAVYMVAFVGLQLVLAAWLETQPWWVMLTVAFFIGAVMSHALFVLMHEATHNLIFKNRLLNKLSTIFVNFGQGIPSGISFQEFHLKHHAHLNDYDKDPDVPFLWEGRLTKNSPVLKMLWMSCLFFIQAMRPMGKLMKLFNVWSVSNLVIIFALDIAIVYFLGWSALLYMVLSTVFGLGIHPIGARWVQEHFMFKEGQETYSYYGVGNKFTFNIGYHNEHHDLMNIPWIFLPKIKKIAPELYDTLYAHTSWLGLYFRVIFDRKFSLFNRVVRLKTTP